MTWPVSTCVRPLFVFFDVELEAYMLQIHYLINWYLRIKVRKIRTIKLMHDIYIYICVCVCRERERQLGAQGLEAPANQPRAPTSQLATSHFPAY
jgi:hypothetical protein